ncbi:DUF6226 family protein [Cellulosimicrobium sp. CUA-896]|uniref:DUF6226 family protein n=1 Tax=Cellulosimicrobium sp. CUA-896 TaxID=1517881 RepID=UPI0009643568|nr:DUF6226 family protein [Cellulosimicrobium sp. CUA-896]OLT50941.1 hypothetical protein BJF88_02225 [Cellulosimicrobium sp. CUA-896]
MPAYVRPPVPRQVFHDAEGRPYEYGERWADRDGPPEDAYSVDSHPERFAPVVDVADALVAHLVATYDVTVEAADLRDVDVPPHTAEEPAHPLLAGIRHLAQPVERVVRLVPTADDAAPLTVVVTGYPGVQVRAGVLHVDAFPACGCDACDDSAESQAEMLEHLVLAVAAGRFGEGVRRAWDDPRTVWVRYATWSDDNSSYGEGRRRRRGLTPARRRLAALPNGRWSAWPPRA